MKYLITTIIVFILLAICYYFFTLHKRELFLFSAVNATVTLNGKPVMDAVVTQNTHFTWGNKDFSATVTTSKGANPGSFVFPKVVTHNILAHLLPHEPSVSQKMTLMYKDTNYILWYYNRHDYTDMSELDRHEPIHLTCELTDPEIRFNGTATVQGNVAYGVCRLSTK
jgi:hypothetical protein